MNNTQLISHIERLLRREATLDIEVLEALNEIHRRKLWTREGHSSFHAYCVESLRMSEDSASRRLRVAELLQRYPDVLKPLILERRVHLSGLALLYGVVTDENAERLFRDAAGKSRRQIEEMRALERQKEDITSGVRRQPALSCVIAPHSTVSAETPVLQVAVVGGQQQHIEIRSPDRHAFRTMMSSKTRQSLERICAMTGKNYEDAFADMVTMFEEVLEKQAVAQAQEATSRKPRRVGSSSEAAGSAAAEAASRTSSLRKQRKRHPTAALVRRNVPKEDLRREVAAPVVQRRRSRRGLRTGAELTGRRSKSRTTRRHGAKRRRSLAAKRRGRRRDTDHARR